MAEKKKRTSDTAPSVSKDESFKNPHDRFVKKAFSHRQVALEMFDRYLPDDLKRYAKVDEYEKVSETLVDHDLDEDLTDLLFKIPMDYGENHQGAAYVYELTEHQRKVPKDMPVRELEMKAKIARYHMNKYKTDKIPLIRIFVVYNGQTTYTAPRELWEMTDAPKEIAQKTWRSSYQLVDVGEEEVLDVATYMWLRSAFLLLKYIDDPGLLEMVARIGYNLEQIAREMGGPDYLRTIYAYAYKASKHVKAQDLAMVMREKIGGKAGEIAMTVAEELREIGREEGLEVGRIEGRQEGRQEGLSEVAFIMFTKGYDLEKVSEITGLSSDQVLRLKGQWDQSK